MQIRERLATTDQTFTLKVTLADVEPAIWRRFVVPCSVTLDLLHDVLQVVMGWTDDHIHRFDAGDTTYFADEELLLDHGTDEHGVRLDQVVTKVGHSLTYLYDFGDSWLHTIKVVAIDNVPDGHIAYAACTGGARACPPEDVGGVPGYEMFLDALASPDHPDHEERVEWIGGEFDPDDFNVDDVNEDLAVLARWSRSREPFAARPIGQPHSSMSG